MKRHEQLLLENKAWAKDRVETDPSFFERMSASQKPEFLWIGCSDSRVSPTEITQTQPGEIFIHRNIANLVVHTDLNLLSVLQYAVEVLEIKYVIVCGHYGCGGVKAALTQKSFGIIDKWLRHIKDVYRLNQATVDAAGNEEQRANVLVECNVREQLYHVAQTAIIQKSWAENKRPHLLGWVFDMNDGGIKSLLELAPGAELNDPVYQYSNFVADKSLSE